MGRNLLCIFSKKHIENPPELKVIWVFLMAPLMSSVLALDWLSHQRSLIGSLIGSLIRPRRRAITGT